MWTREWRYTKRKHKDKSASWRKERYFGKYNQTRKDYWVFGDKSSNQYIWKFNWTTVRRHTMVKGGSSPEDPDLKAYWQNRITTKAGTLRSKKWR